MNEQPGTHWQCAQCGAFRPVTLLGGYELRRAGDVESVKRFCEYACLAQWFTAEIAREAAYEARREARAQAAAAVGA